MLAGNPFADALGDKIKIEVLLTLRKIKFVGEDEINEEDILAMKEEAKERLKAEIEAAKVLAEKQANGETEDKPEGEEGDAAEEEA